MIKQLPIQVTIELPALLAKLPKTERETLVRAGVHEAMRARALELKAERQQAQAHVRHFEEEYGVDFARFERELLPTLDSPQVHEDYNDWFFWQGVLTEKEQLLLELHPA